MPSWSDIRLTFPAMVRGTGLGAVLGILPGGGMMLASFASYALEKKISKHPELRQRRHRRRSGARVRQQCRRATSFIPMLTLGIPSNPVMALMIGAMIIQGIQPGPSVMTEQPALFWGIVVSMWVGNVMLLVLNLPLIGLWVKMISVPYHLCIRPFSSSARSARSASPTAPSIVLMAVFGLLGYIFHKFGCEPAPMMLGFILGPMMEEFLRRALLLSKGDPIVLVTRPISAVMLGLPVRACWSCAVADVAQRSAKRHSPRNPPEHEFSDTTFWIARMHTLVIVALSGDNAGVIAARRELPPSNIRKRTRAHGTGASIRTASSRTPENSTTSSRRQRPRRSSDLLDIGPHQIPLAILEARGL